MQSYVAKQTVRGRHLATSLRTRDTRTAVMTARSGGRQSGQHFSSQSSRAVFSVLQRLHSEIGRTISDVQKRDGQTNRQTDKKLNVFG